LRNDFLAYSKFAFKYSKSSAEDKQVLTAFSDKYNKYPIFCAFTSNRFDTLHDFYKLIEAARKELPTTFLDNTLDEVANGEKNGKQEIPDREPKKKSPDGYVSDQEVVVPKKKGRRISSTLKDLSKNSKNLKKVVHDPLPDALRDAPGATRSFNESSGKVRKSRDPTPVESSEEDESEEEGEEEERTSRGKKHCYFCSYFE
jgi:hypothetical protein